MIIMIGSMVSTAAGISSLVIERIIGKPRPLGSPLFLVAAGILFLLVLPILNYRAGYVKLAFLILIIGMFGNFGMLYGSIFE